MLELDGIVKVRRPDGARWNDGAAYWFQVRLVDPDAHVDVSEEAPVEDIQSYARFQCYVAREFGLWFRYEPAEDADTGARAWSEFVASVWNRPRISEEPVAPYFDAAPWAQEES